MKYSLTSAQNDDERANLNLTLGEVICVNNLTITEKLGSDPNQIKLWRCFDYVQDDNEVNAAVVLLQEPFYVEKPGIEPVLVKTYNFFLDFKQEINKIYFFNICPMKEKNITLKKYTDEIIAENFEELNQILSLETTTDFYFGARKFSKVDSINLRSKVIEALLSSLNEAEVNKLQLIDESGDLAYPVYGKALFDAEPFSEDKIK